MVRIKNSRACAFFKFFFLTKSRWKGQRENKSNVKRWKGYFSFRPVFTPYSVVEMIWYTALKVYGAFLKMKINDLSILHTNSKDENLINCRSEMTFWVMSYLTDLSPLCSILSRNLIRPDFEFNSTCETSLDKKKYFLLNHPLYRNNLYVKVKKRVFIFLSLLFNLFIWTYKILKIISDHPAI